MATNLPITSSSRRIDLTGEQYGRWNVVRFSFVKDQKAYWLCRCECGTERNMATGAIRSGSSQSCGCWSNERKSERRTHGASGYNGKGRSPLYVTWCEIRRRCLSEKCHAYDRYGGRGIRICDRWKDGEGGLTGFECFVADMGQKPTPAHSIERKEVNGNYEPGNCIWATTEQQAQNKRDNRYVTVRGEQVLITHAARRVGISLATAYDRMKNGWSEDKTFTTPPRRPRVFADQAAKRAWNAKMMAEKRAANRAKGEVSRSDMWWRNNRERHRENTAKWRSNNIDRAREVSRIEQALRRSTPWGRITNRVCPVMHRGVRSKSHGWGKYNEALGYRWCDLRDHLEKQFSPAMTWENWGDVWEVDHIVPISTFRYESIDCPEFKRAWSLSNLRPLLRDENAAKGSKLLSC